MSKLVLDADIVAAAESVLEQDDSLVSIWAVSGPSFAKYNCLFGYLDTPNGRIRTSAKNLDADDQLFVAESCGCLTQTKLQMESRGIRFPLNAPEEVQRRFLLDLMADERIPREGIEITEESVPAFGEWRQRYRNLFEEYPDA